MRYGAYRFRLVFEDDAVLPPFKGSTLRGAFGTALKSVVCALKRETCDECILRERCVYARVFEAPDLPPGGGMRYSPPHAFVLEPPLSDRTEHRVGDTFECGLKLFGWANDYLPYFVYAIQSMGNFGLGRRMNGRRGRFRLEEAASSQGIVFSAADGLISSDGVTVNLEIPRVADREYALSSVRVVLETPLRIKNRNRFLAELPFHVLARAAMRRISSLWAYFDGGEPDLDYRGLAERAHGVHIENSSIRWVEWRRYSNRQEQEMLMGGLIGEISYRGDLGEFMPLIRCCEELHLGKATTFGLGKMRAVAEGA